MNRLRAEALHALDVQVGLYNFYKSRDGFRLMVGFIRSLVEKGYMDVGHEEDTEEYILKTGGRIAQETATTLGHASTYYITPEMMLLNEHAGQSVPNSPFTYEEPPTDSGFVLLPRPLITNDVHGLQMSARAFAWWKTEVVMRKIDDNDDIPMAPIPTLMYALFSNKNDTDHDEYMRVEKEKRPEDWLRFPTWSLVHWQFIHFNESWGELTGITAHHTIDASIVGDIPGNQMHSWIAFLKTFFQLVKQEIGILEPQSLDRARFRRLKGTGIPPEYGDVRIVTLRRVRPRPEGEIEGPGTEVEWSHRWPVQGHWANAYHPSCEKCQALGHACKTHPAVWKDTYIKGPENKPLIIKDKVFVWKR